jgi:uroporphyrinogen decarboxylase
MKMQTPALGEKNSLPPHSDLAVRFDKRIESARLASGPTKDFVKRSIRRQGSGRCPVRLRRFSLGLIAKYFDELADLCCTFPDDVILVRPYFFFTGYQPLVGADALSPSQLVASSGEWTDEWGTRWGSAIGGVSAVPVGFPIRDWSELDDYLAHRFPDPQAPGRLDGALGDLSLFAESKYCIGEVHLALFERLHTLRGMEQTFVDLMENEREVRRLLDALADYLLQLIRRWCDTPVSGLFLTDDWGSQTGMMISPAMWRRIFKPYYRVILDEIHHHGKDVLFHSCGNIIEIIPDLIDLGVDVLDNIQPGAMDPAEIARRFAGHLSFSGGLDEHNLARLSALEIRDMVRRTIDLLGRRNGYGFIASPCNEMTAAAPLEALQVLFEECHRN